MSKFILRSILTFACVTTIILILFMPKAHAIDEETHLIVNPMKFEVGQTVNVFWHDKWYPAKIIKMQKDRWKIHYIGYSKQWDEWVPKRRIQGFRNTHYREESADISQFHPGQAILAKWHGKWVPAQVIDINDKNQIHVHFSGYDDYWNEWVKPDEVSLLENNRNSALSGKIEQFFLASKENNLKKIQYLLKSGVNVNATDKQGASALHFAAKNKHEDIVKYLIKHGANINHKDSYGQTALMWAANRWDWQLVEYLLAKGADPKIGRSPLFFAIQTGKPDIVRLLINKGVDVNKEVAPGITPLKLAENFHRKKIIRMLKKAGAKLTNDTE